MFCLFFSSFFFFLFFFFSFFLSFFYLFFLGLGCPSLLTSKEKGKEGCLQPSNNLRKILKATQKGLRKKKDRLLKEPTKGDQKKPKEDTTSAPPVKPLDVENHARKTAEKENHVSNTCIPSHTSNYIPSSINANILHDMHDTQPTTSHPLVIELNEDDVSLSSLPSKSLSTYPPKVAYKSAPPMKKSMLVEKQPLKGEGEGVVVERVKERKRNPFKKGKIYNHDNNNSLSSETTKRKSDPSEKEERSTNILTSPLLLNKEKMEDDAYKKCHEHFHENNNHLECITRRIYR